MIYQRSYYQSFFKLIELYSRSKGDLFPFLEQVNTKYGEKLSCRTPGKSIHFLFCKEAVTQVLIKNERDFGKTPYTLQLDKLLGKGLLTSEGSHWQHNRKLIQPFFKQESFSLISQNLEQEVRNYLDIFSDQMTSKISTINLVDFIHSLILNLTAKTLFGLNIENYTHEISEGLKLFIDYTSGGSLSKLLFGFHTKSKIKQFRKRIAAIIDAEIASPQEEESNFLSYLIKKSREKPEAINRQQIIDEALTMLFAGHETTANVLCWALVELSCDRDWQNRLIAGAKTVAWDKPSLNQIRSIKDFELVFLEALRLYPPAWVLARSAKRELEVANVCVKQKDLVVIPTWFIQRNNEYWENPNTFNPQRFDCKRNLHDGSFFPFSMGVRTCIGRQLAHVQADLILANIFKHFMLKLAQPKPNPLFHVLLRPPNKILVHLEKIS